MNDTRKKEYKVTINLKPGPASPAQYALWRKFWQRVIVETKKEAAK
jgi:hypothetical protein